MAGGDDVAHRYGNGSLLDRRVSSSKPTTVTRTVVLAPPITPLAAFRLGRNCVAVRVDAPSLLFQAMLAGSGVSLPYARRASSGGPTGSYLG